MQIQQMPSATYRGLLSPHSFSFMQPAELNTDVKEYLQPLIPSVYSPSHRHCFLLNNPTIK